VGEETFRDVSGRCAAIWPVELSLLDSKERVTNYLLLNPGLSSVAVEGATICGVLNCGHDGRRAYLNHLAVAPIYRGQGIGQRLVQRSIQQLKNDRIGVVHLSVRDSSFKTQKFW